MLHQPERLAKAFRTRLTGVVVTLLFDAAPLLMRKEHNGAVT